MTLRKRTLHVEGLEHRRVLTASFGWDGPGVDSAELTYYIGDAPSYLDQAEVDAAIETALDAWSDVVDIEFTPTDQSGLNDSLDFTFENIDGAGGTLAQAYFPDDINPPRIAGDVQFDLSEQWEIGNDLGNRAFDLVAVAVHEIGHSLGLEHIDESDAVLAPTISANEQFAGLSEHDVEAIQALYATAQPLDTPAEPTEDSDTEDGDDSPVDSELPTDNSDSDTGSSTNPWNSHRWFISIGRFNFHISFGNTSPFGARNSYGRLSADMSVAFNIGQPSDVNQDSTTSAMDALLVINAINSGTNLSQTSHMLDTNGDSILSSVDALIVVNTLNQNNLSSSAEDTTTNAASDSNDITDSTDTAAAESSDDGEDTGEASDEESTESDSHDCSPLLAGLGFGNTRFSSGGILSDAVDSIFENFDANADGNLSTDELPEFAWDYLTEKGVDANDDNFITLDEIDSAMESYRLDRFESVDENGDGLLSEEELPEVIWRRLENADVDEDGGVSFDELETYRSLSRFERWDGNQDGGITEDEVPDRLWNRIRQFDDDGDEVIVEEELPVRDSDLHRPINRVARAASRAFRAFRGFAR